MPGGRLEFNSSYGDQTVSSIHFVVHGTSRRDGEAILQHGLRFIEGRATVSSNLIQAYGYATDPTRRGYSNSDVPVDGDDPGMILVIHVPPQFHLAYGVFTSAYIDRSERQVLGAPLRYAGGRKQLALYMSDRAEDVRRRIEQEVVSGFAMNQHPQFLVDSRFVIGWFDPSAAFIALVKQLEVAIKAFEPIDSLRYGAALAEIMRSSVELDVATVQDATRTIVRGTIESVIMSRLRMMRWQGLAMLGYHFLEGREEVQVAPVQDIAEQRRRMDEIGRWLASSPLLIDELSWLKTYGAHQLELMRIELDAEELERLPD